MNYYAYFDENGYCTDIVFKEDDNDNGVIIDEFNSTYLGKKYDFKNKIWLNEYISSENKFSTELPPPTEQEKILANQEYIMCLLEINGGF